MLHAYCSYIGSACIRSTVKAGAPCIIYEAPPFVHDGIGICINITLDKWPLNTAVAFIYVYRKVVCFESTTFL